MDEESPWRWADGSHVYRTCTARVVHWNKDARTYLVELEDGQMTNWPQDGTYLE